MQLRYSNRTPEIVEIEERLKLLTLAYKTVLDEINIEPALIDGSKEYLGFDKMNDYLDQLDHEKEQWYYCNC